jgi:signal peptidase I
MEGAVCPDCGGRQFDVETRNFIKRVAGLPGEAVTLRDGDVYVDGAIARKPDAVQDQLWFHVFDTAFWPRREVVRTWDFSAAPGLWEERPQEKRLVVDATGSDRPAMASFAPTIVDLYAYDGPSYELSPRSLSSAGRYVVGDCRIRALARVLADGGSGEVLLELEDGGHRFVLSAAPGGGEATLWRDGAALGRRDVAPLAPGEARWMSLANHDDRVVAGIGGRDVFRHDYRGRSGGPHAVRFGARGARVAWDRIVIERDVYYCDTDRASAWGDGWRLGPDEYFVLGDNSPASSDSRRWPSPGVPAENLIGRAFLVFWPAHEMRWLSVGGGRPAEAGSSAQTGPNP